MCVGAIDGLVRGATMHVTDRDVREHVSLPLTLYGITATNAALGALYGAGGAVVGLLLDSRRRLSRFVR